MSAQYPTPISFAGSYEEIEPERKKTRRSHDRGEKSQRELSSLESQDTMSRLLARSWTFRNRAAHDRNDHTPIYTVQQSEVEQELAVWGYMLSHTSESLSFLLSKESRCGAKNRAWDSPTQAKNGNGVILKNYDGDNVASSGYLIGSHSECDVVIDAPGISARHCVIFKIHVTVPRSSRSPDDRAQNSDQVAVQQRVFLQDISGQGTYVNSTLLKLNEIALLNDHDILALSDQGPSWTFRQTSTPRHKGFEERFCVGKTIGHGHFAEVVEVKERSTGQTYAAKMIQKTLVADDATFLQEIGLLMACTHPLITCIRDVFDVGDRIYLILELAAGGELFDRIILKGKFSEAETRTLFHQIFSALRYLHEHNIAHRDIKPENILLVSRDSLDIRLADFGLAKIIESSTSTSTLAGTPSYIPPEMLATPKSGNKLSYTTKVDSWSAGVVLYICLCGFPPFSQELAPPPMKTQIKEGLYKFQKPYWDSISDSAIDLVQKLLTVDPEVRLGITEAMRHPFMQSTAKGHTKDSTPHESYVSKARQGIKRQRTMLKDIGRPEIRKS